MRSISDHPDDLIWRGPTGGLCAWRRSRRGGPSASFDEAVRRKAEVWLIYELTSWRAQFQPKMTQLPEFRLK